MLLHNTSRIGGPTNRKGFELFGQDNNLNLTVDDGDASTSGYGDTQSWIFFAVTYDGTLNLDNVKFYKGSASSEVTQVGTATINKGQVGDDTAGLGIGNKSGIAGSALSNPDDSPFDGYLDNVRVYGSKVDGSGVLTLTQLESIRTGDVPVSSTSPTNGAIGVAVNTTITATFSAAMDSSTITTSTFTVSTGGINISGTVSYNSTTKTATFTPSSNLTFPTTYTATITTGVKDSAGTAMVSNYTWSFTTGSVTEPVSYPKTGFDRDNYLPSLNDQNDYDRAWISVIDTSPSANTTGSPDTIIVTIKAGFNSIAFILKETGGATAVFTTNGREQNILYPVGTSAGYVEDFNSGSHNYPALGASIVGLNLKQFTVNTDGNADLRTNGDLTVTAGDTIELLYNGATLDSASIGFNSGFFNFTPSVVSPVTTSSLSDPNLVISITDPDENLNPVAKDVIGFADNSALLAGSPATGTSRVQIEAIDQITGSTLSISGADIIARHIMLVETGNNTGVFSAIGKVFGSNTVTSSSQQGNLLIGSQTTSAYAGQDITLGKTTGNNAVGCIFRIIEANASGRIGLYEAKGTTIDSGNVVGLLPVLGFTTGSDFIGKGTSTFGIVGVTSGITTTRVVAISKTTSAFGSQTDKAVNQGTSTSGLIKLIEGDKYCLVAISEFEASAGQRVVATFSTYEEAQAFASKGGSVTVTIDTFQLAGPRSGDTLKVSYLDELDSGGVSGTVTGALSYGVAGVTGTLERDNAAPDINDLVTITVVDGNLNTNTSAQESVAAGSRLWGGTTTNNRGDLLTVEAYSTSSKKISLSHPDGSAIGTQTIRIAKTDNSLVWMVPASLASASSDRFQNPLSAGSATFSLGTESVSTIPLVKGSSSDADSFLRSLASTSSFVATLDGLDNTVEISPDGTHWISIPIVETGANSSTFVGTIGFDCTAARITTSTIVTASTIFSDFTGTSSITFSSEGGNTTLTSIIGTGSVVRISDGTFAEVKEVTGVSGSVLSVEKLSNSSFYTPWKTWVQVVGNDLDNNRLDTTLAGSSVFRIGGFYGATYRIRYNDAADANNAYLGGDTLAATTPNVAFQTNTGVLSVSPSGTVGLNSQIEVVLVDDDLNVSTATANTTFINQTTTFLNLNEAGLGNPQGTSSATNNTFKNSGTAKQILVSRATTVTSAFFAEASNTVTVTLTETGANSGTFKGTYKLSSGSSTTGAESPPILKVSNGDTITVFYNDSPSATSENNLSAYTTVSMLVQGGLGALSLSKSEAFLSGDSVVITLSDMDKNTPNSLDSATVSYKSSSDTSSSSMSLTETAANSGMFKGTLRTSTTSSSSTTPPTVRAVVNGAVTITYTDDSPAADITALFSTKNFGAVLDITSASVTIDGNAIVSLSDKETNTSISTANVASLNIKSTTDSTGADVIVTETGADTGSFLGTIKVSTGSSVSNTNIKAAVGDTLTVTFTDRPDATGLLSVVTDTAMVTVAVTPTPTPIPGASPTPTATPTPTGVVVITGTVVVSTAPGAPISSAMVSTDTGGFTATTGADGTFTIINVTPGTYTLTASATGFVSSSQSVTVTAGVTTTVHFDLVPVTVTPTATATPTPTPTPTPCEPEDISVSPPKSLTLKRNASGDITVTVTGEDDCAVAGEPVTATTNTAGEKRISISPASAATDESGEAEFTITAKNKPGNAKVTFKAGAAKSLKYTVKVRNK